MAKTRQDIDRIHSSGTAVEGSVYKGPNGALYYGNKSGRLVREDLLKGDFEGTTLNSKIKMGKFTLESIISLLERDEEESANPTKDDIFAEIYAANALMNC